MQYKVSLIVDGLRLEDDSIFEVIARYLSDLIWTEESGRTLATLIVDDNPVLGAVAAANRIRDRFPHTCIHRVDRDLVSIADIANRVGVSREAVRLWSVGGRGPGMFPTPTGSVGGGAKGATKVWLWGDVNAWLDNHYRLGDGYRYLTDRQHAQVIDRLTQPGYKTSVSVAVLHSVRAWPHSGPSVRADVHWGTLPASVVNV
jgi:hypothetical protein